ncbi:MAG: tRNA (5-methylaminomethyl-2-thiouridine)(34)-methyltransferase MnmD [Cytophagaceae bacterium]
MSIHRLLVSGDGSHTILNSELNETYHSHHGAMQESEYVFIKNGLDLIVEKTINVFEVGFGTGLNGLLTLHHSCMKAKSINYITLEPYPLDIRLVKELNYTESTQLSPFKEKFYKMHSAEFSHEIQMQNFCFLKIKSRLEDYSYVPGFADIIYFDAFAPSKQSEIWDFSNIEKLYAILKPGGILVTYCAQGQFKRNLKQASFIVETLPGPPGKKEMTRGIKEK